MVGSKMEIFRHPTVAMITTVQFHIKLLITIILIIVTITIGLILLFHFHIMNCQTLVLQIIMTTTILKCIISIPLMMMMHTYIKP